MACWRRSLDLTILAGEVADLSLSSDGRIAGIVTADGRCFRCGAAVLTTGTFLNGMIHIGAKHAAGGRVGEAAVLPLAKRLRGLGLPLGRLKTGTPPRLSRASIDWERLPEDQERRPAGAVQQPGVVAHQYAHQLSGDGYRRRRPMR